MRGTQMLKRRVQMRKNLLWYIRFFAMLSACVFIFFIMQLFAYHQFAEQLRDEFVQKQQVYLSRGATAVEAGFNLYRSTQLEAVQDLERIQKLSAGKLTKNDHAHMLVLKEKLVSILGHRLDATPFFLVFANQNGAAVTTETMYSNLREAIAKENLYFGGMSYDELTAFLNTNASSSYLTVHANVLPFGQGSMTSRTAKPTLVIVQRMNGSPITYPVYALWMYQTSALHDAISNGSDTSDFFALSFGDKLLYSTDPDVDVQAFSLPVTYDAARGLTYFRVTLSSLGLTACLALEDSVVLSSLESFSTLRTILLVSFLILAAVLLLLVLFYFVRPLNRLYQRAIHSSEEAQEERNVFTQLEKHIDSLSQDRQQMKKKLEHWDKLLHRSLLVRLMRGEPLPPSSAEMLSSMEYSAGNHTFRVALVGCLRSGSHGMANAKPLLDEYMQECSFPLYAWIYDTYAALVFPDDFLEGAQKDEALAAYLENMYRELSRRLQLTEPFVVAVGLEHRDIRNLHLSFEEAKAAYYDARHWQRTGVVFYEVYSAGQSLYSLTYDELNRLFNLLSIGDADEAIAYLDTLAARLGGSSSHPLEEWLLRQFSTEIRGVALRVSVKYQEPSILRTFPTVHDFVTLQEWLDLAHTAFRYICQIAQTTQGGERQLSDELLHYISQYYNDSAISLTTVAEAFSMSERSLSRYFKDRMQDTFSSILEKYRLSEAEKLLLADDSTLRVVAEKVGYANSSTFLKAFKRRYGLTPSEWVQQARVIKDIPPDTDE